MMVINCIKVVLASTKPQRNDKKIFSYLLDKIDTSGTRGSHFV